MLAAEEIMNLDRFPLQNDALIGQKDFEDFLGTPHMMVIDARQREVDIVAMGEVTERIREQVRFIIHSVRCWRMRHVDFDNSTRLRYSAYEGALCYTDLRRHWAYYRHAMKELEVMKRA